MHVNSPLFLKAGFFGAANITAVWQKRRGKIGRDGIQRMFLLFSSSDFRSDTFFNVQKEQRPDLSLCVALRLPVYCLHLSVMDLTLSLRCHWHWICRQQLVRNELPSQWQHGLQKFDLKENSRQRGEEIILACQNVSTSSRKFYNYTFHQIMIFFNNELHISIYANIFAK